MQQRYDIQFTAKNGEIDELTFMAVSPNDAIEQFLEGSGQLEKDASLICLLSQDPVDRWDEKNRKHRTIKLKIVKGRNAGCIGVHS